MNSYDIARRILAALGGETNVVGNTTCMTRLRIFLHDKTPVDMEALKNTANVLGVAPHGKNGLDIVFGPLVAANVAHAFSILAGFSAESDLEFTAVKKSSKNRINTGTDRYDHNAGDNNPPAAAPDEMSKTTCPDASSQFTQSFTASHIKEILDGESDNACHPSLLVLHGPTINLFGLNKSPNHGAKNYLSLLTLCHMTAREEGFQKCRCFQSNHEGDLIDQIQAAWGIYDGIVCNPAAYAYTSLALFDALKAVEIPCVEVDSSDASQRGPYRKTSHIRPACITAITDQGIEGYRIAIKILAQYLREHKA